MRRSCFPVLSDFVVRLGSKPSRVLVYTPSAMLSPFNNSFDAVHVVVGFLVGLECDLVARVRMWV
jgi:hypothetical protein